MDIRESVEHLEDIGRSLGLESIKISTVCGPLTCCVSFIGLESTVWVSPDILEEWEEEAEAWRRSVLEARKSLRGVKFDLSEWEGKDRAAVSAALQEILIKTGAAWPGFFSGESVHMGFSFLCCTSVGKILYGWTKQEFDEASLVFVPVRLLVDVEKAPDPETCIAVFKRMIDELEELVSDMKKTTRGE